MLQKIVSTNSDASVDTSSTEIGININQVISTEQTLVTEGEQILLADGEHDLMADGEQTLIVTEKDDFGEKELAGGDVSMETGNKSEEVTDDGPVESTGQEHVLESSSQDHTLPASTELEHNHERTGTENS